MKILKSILFIFFVSIAIQSPQAAELHIATDSEVETFLNEDLKNNWYGVYITDEPNKKIGYLHEENKFENDENGKKLFSNNIKFYGKYSHDGLQDWEEIIVNTFFESGSARSKTCQYG